MAVFEALRPVSASVTVSNEAMAVFEADADATGGLRFTEANAAFEQLCGYGTALLTGRTLSVIAAPEGAAMLQRIEVAVAQGAPVRGDLACVCRDGRALRLECALLPAPAMPIPSGTAARLRRRFTLLARDVTQERATDAQTRLIQGLLAKSFMLAEAPLAIVKPDGNFLMTNRFFDRLGGRPEGGYAGRPSLEMVSPAFRPAMEAARDRQTADGQPFEIDTEIVSAEGLAVKIRLAASVIEGQDRQIFRVVTLRAHAAENRLPEPKPPERGLAFVDLAAIRIALGDRWEAAAPRVLAIAEGMIQRRMEDGDRLSRNGERGFTLRFAHAEEAQARLRAAAMLEDIRIHLIGQGDGAPGAGSRAPQPGPPPTETQVRTRLDRVEAEVLEAGRAPPGPPVLRPLRVAGTGAQIGLHVRAASEQPGFEEDLAALKRVADMPADRAGQLVCLDVGLETFLSRRKTERYVEACAQIGALARPNLILMLSALPAGITASLVQDIARRLKPFCGGLGCHVTDLAPPPVDLRLVPMTMVALPAPECRPGDVALFDRLRRLTTLLQVHHTRLLALDVPGPSRQILHDAGAAYVTTEDAPSG